MRRAGPARPCVAARLDRRSRLASKQRREGDEPMRWTCRSFEELTGREVYEVLALRQRVFVVEQACAFQEADGRDPQARHLMGWGGGRLVACARLLPAAGSEPRSIGRVATAPEARGAGLGKALMGEALRILLAEDPAAPIALGAQAHLAAPFYEPLGFRIVGEPYEEDGIPHVHMRLDPA